MHTKKVFRNRIQIYYSLSDHCFVYLIFRIAFKICSNNTLYNVCNFFWVIFNSNHLYMKSVVGTLSVDTLFLFRKSVKNIGNHTFFYFKRV